MFADLKNISTATCSRHTMNLECEQFVKIYKKECQKVGVVFVLHSDTNYPQLCGRISKKEKLFSGIFEFYNFPDIVSRTKVKFITDNRNITIQDVKMELSKFTKSSLDKIQIQFFNQPPLGDENDFLNTWNCDGMGGEVFKVRHL